MKMPEGVWVPLEMGTDPFVYVCASAGSHRTNLHVALRPKADSMVRVESEIGLTFEVRGAERIEILSIPDSVALRHGFSKRQRTCRNFQFGVQAFGAAS